MAMDSKDVDELVNRIVMRLVPMLAGRIGGGGGGFQCTGSKFACGEYKCGATTPTHSCRDVFECNITFTEPKFQL